MEVEMIGKFPGKLTLADDKFSLQFNEGLVHQVITAYRAAARQGSKAQKTRSEVRGGGIKPWRQKGTGRARAGTIRSPLWEGGGVVFAAKPRDYSQKVNKKAYRKAMWIILSELIRQKRLKFVQEMSLAEPKTKLLVDELKSLDLNNVLIVTENENLNLELAARNLPKVAVCCAKNIDPVSLISFENILMTKEALNQVEGRMA